MIVRSIVVAAILALPAAAVAGEIYGTLREGGRPLQQTKIEIQCGSTNYTATTDSYGSYRTLLRERGRCRLTAHVHGTTASFDVFSYPDPVRYEFDVQASGSNVNLIRR